MRLLKVEMVYESDDFEDVFGFMEYTETGYIDLDHVTACVKLDDQVEVFCGPHTFKIVHDFTEFCAAWIG